MSTPTPEPATHPSPAPWDPPPRPLGPDGAPRRIGVEMEFNGLSVADAAAVVRDTMGGTLRRENDFRWHVEGAQLGDFLCELDVKFAHRAVDSEFGQRIRDAAARASAEFLPIEIVGPPAPLPEAHLLDALPPALKARGAQDTWDSFFFAFGVQLNPSLPSLEIDYILPCFQAFLVARGWLRRAIDVDVSRRIWFFEKPFADDYCARVLADDYRPDMQGFIADYLQANPTRNRELDLLPLLAHLDEDAVRTRLPDETISARPTWHYRLPNSEMGSPHWSLGLEWRRWLKVERLAEDPETLRRARHAWLAGARGDDPARPDALSFVEATA
jgi:hypothetical protein